MAKHLFRLSAFLAALASVAAALAAVSAARDDAVLERAAREAVAGTGSDAERIVALNRWVYRKEGFAKNKGSFLTPRLGPTPLQVHDSGGDCADKSRLLAAMLDEIGIDATLVMLYPAPGTESVHTVVYAWHEDGVMAADPVYDLVFPDGRGGYLPVSALRESDEPLLRRLEELRRERGPADKINRYDSPLTHYRHATTFNWEKNFVMAALASVLRAVGRDPAMTSRPRFLEDPKRFVAYAAFGAAAFLAVIALVARRRHRRASRAGKPPVGNS